MKKRFVDVRGQKKARRSFVIADNRFRLLLFVARKMSEIRRSSSFRSIRRILGNDVTRLTFTSAFADSNGPLIVPVLNFIASPGPEIAFA